MTCSEQRWLNIGKAIDRACAELPEGFELCIELERDAGTLRLYLPDTDATEDEFNGDTFADQINNAISLAIERAARNQTNTKD